MIIGGNSWAWRRSRSPGTIEWRAEDPSGTAFERVEHPEVCRAARRMTAALRLTMSVQDWLETRDGLVFLEVNPQGRWLFLPGALGLVSPRSGAIFSNRCPRRPSSGASGRGRSSGSGKTSEGRRRPRRTMVFSPSLLEPSWIDHVAPDQNALDTARRSHEQALSRAQAAEEKASRLVQVALALLTLATAVGAYQLGFVLDRSWPMALTLAPASLAVCCLGPAASRGSRSTELGSTDSPPSRTLSGSPGDPGAVLIVREEHGRAFAAWTSDKKHTALMQARALVLPRPRRPDRRWSSGRCMPCGRDVGQSRPRPCSNLVHRPGPIGATQDGAPWSRAGLPRPPEARGGHSRPKGDVGYPGRRSALHPGDDVLVRRGESWRGRRARGARRPLGQARPLPDRRPRGGHGGQPQARPQPEVHDA